MADTGPNNLIRVDLETAIYRTYKKSRFLELLATKRDALINPSRWEDPFENFFLKSLVQNESGELISLENLARDWYGQCWTYNNDTDAMWRIYSHDQRGIQAKTSIGRLFANLKQFGSEAPYLQFFVGAVEYLTKPQIEARMSRTTFASITLGGQNDGFARLLCVKREAFSHEAEVRLLFADLEPRRGDGRCVLYPLDVNSVFEGVVLDPRLTAEESVALQKELVDAGCTLSIRQSDLYQAPHFTIAIR